MNKNKKKFMITKLELKLHTNSGFSFGSSYYDSIIFLEILLGQKKKNPCRVLHAHYLN